MFAKDTIRLADGPLQNRRLLFNETPTHPLELHAAVAPDGRVLAIEGEPAPTSVTFDRMEYRYEPVYAPDGVQSRADDGCVLYHFAGETRS